MNTRSLVLILLGVLCCSEVFAGIFKCVNEKGETVFQQRPCAKDSKVSEELKIKSATNRGPVALNSKNKKNYELALNRNSMVVTARECNKRNSSYREEVQQASDRLYEIRKTEIDAGNEILQRGFKGLSPSEIASLRSEGEKKLLSKLSKMSKKELDRFCSSQARKARSIAAAAKNRSSGYVEGDLDPEGND